ncbi:hypothetical protein PENTCL1PPCAC_762, partial [Pristionchus entomophagus]
TNENKNARVQMQIGLKDKRVKPFFSLSFWHGYYQEKMYACEFVHQLVTMKTGIEEDLPMAYAYVPQYKRDAKNNIIRIEDAQVDSNVYNGNHTYMCDFFEKNDVDAPLFRSRMRLISNSEIFTYDDDDLWDRLDIISAHGDEPLHTVFFHYCLLIVVIYVITVYSLDLYCRRLQYTTMDREEMEEYFFPPARYTNKLEHFRMMRGATKIEKEKNIGVVPTGLLLEYAD